MTGADLIVGDIIRAPWYQDGDDPDLTGTVYRIERKARLVWVRWHANGTVTPAGDESGFRFDMPIVLVGHETK